MVSSIRAALAAGAALLTAVSAQAAAPAVPPAAVTPSAAAAPAGTTATADGSDLVGTWSSKSRKVHTGPGFYNPVKDQLLEPDLTGISYSFTSDGWYEEAYYRAQSNPGNPKCPQGVMQWQHGKFEKLSNGSLTTTPIKVDGRQLVSNPCKYKESVYTRYDQKELFERYEVVIDEFHNIKRLNLYQFDGKPLIPLYLAYSPPQMLPTQTLNPTSVATGTGGQATATGSSKRKRSVPEQKLEKFFQPKTSRFLDPDHWWWFGVTCTSLGTLAYVFF